ncbi:MAG: sugar ABC transporter permease [Gemmiger sp.]|uniref:carbohydrate ABC transporter permease n=1 Tax=Gemmiger sp. TaxID=2049027 RepID=UPI002E766A92|nr:sugar ABC transporter permease [Gemmiger sp.]MEE0800568.1 sugar ABC transporter permease [Gemmiger sp.]
MPSKTAAPATTKKRRAPNDVNRFGLYFCLPSIVIFLIFSVYPVFRTLQMSFMQYKGFGKETFNGVDNYIRAVQDPLFWDAFFNTIKMWGINIVLQLGLALLLTIIFNDMKYRIKGLSLFRAIFYLPNLIAATSVAFLFKTLLDWKYGSVNQLLLSLHLINQPVDWLGQAVTAQVWVGIIGAWMWFGNSFIMLMAGVQGISRDYFEAATIDGAGRWTIFARITMPLLRPIMLYVAITSLIGGLQLFDIPYLMSGTKGTPGRSLFTAVFYLYDMAFTKNQMGYAAAVAFVLFFIIAICSAVAFRIMNPKED